MSLLVLLLLFLFIGVFLIIFLWFIYIKPFVFCTILTHLEPKKKKKNLDRMCRDKGPMGIYWVLSEDAWWSEDR